MPDRDEEEKSEQLSFDFYEAMLPGDVKRNRVFDSEDDALNAMLDRDAQSQTENVPGDTLEDFPRDTAPRGEVRPATAVTENPVLVTAETEKDVSGGNDIKIVNIGHTNPFPPLTEQNLRRAALGFLAALKPDGFGMRFPSPVPRIRIDAGAFFLAPGFRMPQVVRSVLVLVCMNREGYHLDKAEKAALLATLNVEKAKKASLEEMLKHQDPSVKDDSLFDETRTWDFSRTKNRRYHTCLRRIEKLNQAICRGSKFERLRCEQAANEFYLAVPAGLIAPSEAPSGWGLLTIQDDFSVRTLLDAPVHECPPENQAAFAIRVAASDAKSFLFANGVALAEDGAAHFYPVPRRRRSYSY